MGMSLSGCADNFCFGCTSPGEPVPLQPAQSIMHYRIYDPVSQVNYASGCRISRYRGIYPSVEVSVPLGVEYAADVYAEFIAGNDQDAGPDTRTTAEICADNFVFYTNGFEITPWCLSGYLSTALVDLYAIDMSGAQIPNATATTVGGARFIAVSDDYGPAAFISSGSGCPDRYEVNFWDVVASSQVSQ